MDQDIRWVQRFSNFMKALKKLQEAVTYVRDHYSNEQANTDDENLVDEMIKESLIQRFEYTHELALNVMKDYARYQGKSAVSGSRDSTKEAFQLKSAHLWFKGKKNYRPESDIDLTLIGRSLNLSIQQNIENDWKSCQFRTNLTFPSIIIF